MTYAELVRTLREDRGWSQAELARRAGLNGQTVNRIEHGRIKHGVVSRIKLAKAFGIPVAALDSDHPSQEPAPHGTGHAARASSPIAVATLSEKELLETITLSVKELERRQGGTGSHPSPPTAAPDKSPPRPRRHR